jgi:ABC-2 type transport system permease protein
LLSGLRNIVKKEVKELVRDPRILLGIILVPLLILPLMGLVVTISQEAAEESMKNISVVVIDNDNGPFAINLTNFLELYPNLKIDLLSASSVDDVANNVQDLNATAVIVIPEDFSKNLTNGEKGQLEIYGVFRGSGGIAEASTFSAVTNVLQLFEQGLVVQSLRDASLEPDVVLDPIVMSTNSIVKGKPVNANPDALFAVAVSQFFGFPFAMTLLVILSMQLAATSVASEKEEKTLETLLSLPLSRFTMLLGKLAGSTIVAALGAVATIFGVAYYVNSFSFGATPQVVDLNAVGLSPELVGYAVLGVSLFVSLLSALALAVLVSVFAEDVRGAQSLLGFITIPVFLPMLVLMFTNINTLPLAVRIILLAIPFTHPMFAAQAMITGEYFTAIIGIVYVAMFTLVVLYVAARIFATEKILTMRLRLRRRKVREE